MRTSSLDRSLRPDDFLLSLDAGALFRGTRTCQCPSGGAIRGSVADRHHAGRPEPPGKLPDFSRRHSLFDVAFHRLNLARLAYPSTTPSSVADSPRIVVLEPINLSIRLQRPSGECGLICVQLLRDAIRLPARLPPYKVQSERYASDGTFPRDEGKR